VFSISGMAIVHAYDPAAVQALMKPKWEPDTALTAAAMINLWSVLLGLAAAFAWTILAWGALRELNGVSRLRSTLAFAVYIVLYPPLFLLGVMWGATLL
jgi:hypothetical protein